MKQSITFVAGIAIVFLGSALAYSLRQEPVAPELVFVACVVIGGLWAAVGPTDLARLPLSLFYIPGGISAERLRQNILICDAGTRLSFYAGSAGWLLGVIAAIGRFGGDVSLPPHYFRMGFVALLVGVSLAGIAFQPLKFQFAGVLAKQG